MNLGSMLEQYAKIVLAAVTLGGLASTSAFYFFASAEDVRSLKGRVEGFEARRDGDDCSNALRRLKGARDRFNARPEDLFEDVNIDSAEKEIRRIPNCRER